MNGNRSWLNADRIGLNGLISGLFWSSGRFDNQPKLRNHWKFFNVFEKRKKKKKFIYFSIIYLTRKWIVNDVQMTHIGQRIE